jgi:signal transduction histidine kinase
MKVDIPVPFEKLAWFQERLGLGEQELQRVTVYEDVFLRDKETFAESIYRFFYEIPETRIILGYEKRSRHLRRLWLQWFELLFRDRFNQQVITYLWRSGLRHVEINVDKRFINLGYAFVRQFCHRIAAASVPERDREKVLIALDKMVDFCVLIETHAYVSASSQCDMEVVKGISHQVRNPLTVIGGNILRLQRNVAPDSPVHRVYETILAENKRLEAMVRNTTVYSELYQKDPVVTECALERIISNALKRLNDMPEMKTVKLEMALDPRVPLVQGDPGDLETMFYYLLQNSLEALDPDNPLIRMSSRPLASDATFVEVEIFNTGQPPSPEDIEKLFVPFYSQKPYGSGFGLPISQLAVRKNQGEIYLEPLAGMGTRCLIQLPVPMKSRGHSAA